MTPAPRLPDFTKLSVAVLGDPIADHWLFAQPTRLSREAPVMVLRHEREELGAGGAANVARNLRALGAQVSVFGLVGRDAHGRELSILLEKEGIDVAGLATVPGWTTPTKTRVLAAEARRSPHQVLRIDREPREAAPVAERDRVHAAVREALEDFDALVISDYGYGIVSPETALLAEAFRRANRVAVLDPRANVELFRGALTALTPNIGELARFTHVDVSKLDDVTELRKAARSLVERLEPQWLLVTRGNLGMALFGPGDADGIAVEASGDGEVTDVTGAGDTAAAVFALALAARCDPAQAMVLANAAAGVVVMENGAAVCSPNELASALAEAPVAVRLARTERRA
ncbi:MAG: bifunctional hydroxymethylpyrimidine kinase/phosphomethylpyrimidine kinase [Planctomycetes bacterium]|nr:bifunctional hydroxymethylpyrimidine kinase/phosphomethylpyrimidine kinase [Planctomycetota bacterium]